MTPGEIVTKSKPFVLEFLRAGGASCCAIERATYQHLFSVAPVPHEKGLPSSLLMAETMAQLQAEGRVKIDWTQDGHPWVLTGRAMPELAST